MIGRPAAGWILLNSMLAWSPMLPFRMAGCICPLASSGLCTPNRACMPLWGTGARQHLLPQHVQLHRAWATRGPYKRMQLQRGDGACLLLTEAIMLRA